MTTPDLGHLAVSGTRIALRVTPKAARNRLAEKDGLLRAHVTAPPEKGKANAAVRTLLAKALGVPKSRLVLVRGETSREKIFEVL